MFIIWNSIFLKRNGPMKTTTISATHVTTTTPNTKPENTPTSIRQLCLQGFLRGDKRDVIAARIKELHPNSAAATKSAKHIAWHYGDMKKAGLLDALLKAQAEATDA